MSNSYSKCQKLCPLNSPVVPAKAGTQDFQMSRVSRDCFRRNDGISPEQNRTFFFTMDYCSCSASHKERIVIDATGVGSRNCCVTPTKAGVGLWLQPE